MPIVDFSTVCMILEDIWTEAHGPILQYFYCAIIIVYLFCLIQDREGKPVYT